MAYPDWVAAQAKRLNLPTLQHLQTLVTKKLNDSFPGMIINDGTTARFGERSVPYHTTDQNTGKRAIKHSTTPVEPVMSQVALSRTYRYHFTKGTPAEVRRVFNTAIQTYNATGTVKLIPGKERYGQNSLTLTTYHKTMSASQSGMLELGKGGPSVTYSAVKSVNAGQASLNVTYPESVADSVAIHEVGHALGLDHSTSPRSVMYPVDQGRTTLTSADLKSLKSIYN